MAAVLVKKYNPLEMSEEDVLALATGREKLLDIMLSEMKVCLKKGSNQHFVLHGPRGIGKSFFTRLLKIHHDQSDDFKNSLFLQLPEEQENTNFAADLLDVISTLLEGGKIIDTAPKWTISDNQWQKSKQRLKEAINDIKKNGKLHVFLTQETLQAFIPKLDKIESSRLREFLSDFDEVTIIGSSLRPDLDSDYSKRLFQVFKKLDIEPWTADDFLTYYDKLAQRSNYDKEQLENLKKSKNKIKAISQFTGGSPRLAVILSKLILEKNILDTAQLLDGIIDEITTYYQDITNGRTRREERREQCPSGERRRSAKRTFHRTELLSFTCIIAAPPSVPCKCLSAQLVTGCDGTWLQQELLTGQFSSRSLSSLG